MRRLARLAEASNGAELARRGKEATDLVLDVISGEEEARLITRAVRTDFAPSADPLLVIDIDGGSTEVIVTGGAKTSLAESLELGAVRLTERFVTQDPKGKAAAAALLAEVDARLVEANARERLVGYLSGVELVGALAVRRVVPPELTRCESAGVSFEDVADHLETHGLHIDDVVQKTGCGQTCTACLPDLRGFLARRRDTAA